MFTNKYFANTIEEIAIKSNNLILQIQKESVSSRIIHQKNTLTNSLFLVQQMTTRYRKTISKNLDKLCQMSNKLMGILDDIVERKANLGNGSILVICNMIKNLKNLKK